MADYIQDGKNNWPSTRLVKVEDIRNTIDELKKKQWVCRGQQKCDDKRLLASIDRSNFQNLDRREKLRLEKESIRQFRENYQPYNENEKYWIQNSDILALAMMQHYSIPTRLLDWSYDPKVALLFAIDTKNEAANKDGEIWAFDYQRYFDKAPKQWELYSETKSWGEFNPNLPILFSESGTNNDWFVLQIIKEEFGFSRIFAQKGWFSVVSKFGVDHAFLLEKLLDGREYYQKYIIPKELKKHIRQLLKQEENISIEGLFPNTQTIADTVKRNVFGGFIQNYPSRKKRKWIIKRSMHKNHKKQIIEI